MSEVQKPSGTLDQQVGNAHKIIGNMAAERRGPKMSIPAGSLINAIPCGDEDLYLSEVLDSLQGRIAVLESANAELEKERDDADRRAGAAERHMVSLKDSIATRENWIRKAKEAAGYPYNTSFDVVWADALEALKAMRGD